MPRLQPPVVVVFDEVVIGVPREGQRVQPKRVDRCLHLLAQAGAGGHQMLDVMAQDVVAQDVDPFQRLLQQVQRPRQPAFWGHHRRPLVAHRRQVEDRGSLRVHLQIHRQAALQERLLFGPRAEEFEKGHRVRNKCMELPELRAKGGASQDRQGDSPDRRLGRANASGRGVAENYPFPASCSSKGGQGFSPHPPLLVSF